MQKYSKYKDSGVKWLGAIPSHWEVLAIKHILKLKKNIVGKQSSQFDLLSLTLKGVVKRDMENPEGKFPASFDAYQIVEPNDFVFCNFDNEETPRAVGLSPYKGMITGAYDVLFRKNPKLTDKFLIYYFLYIDDAKRFKPLYKGLRKTVPFDSFMSYKIPIPSLQEQDAIVSYLDSVTSKIDEAIAQQQKMIDLLNERKQIIINDAVTKGLDPKAKMKDSGIEGVGKIPKHWNTRRVASLGVFSKGGNISRDSLQDYGKSAILYGDIYTKYNIIASDIKHFVSVSTAEKAVRIYDGDLLMTGSGETKEDIGKTIVYKGEEAYIGGDVILLRQFQNDSTFLSYCFNSQYAKNFRYKESKGEIVVHIYANAIKKMYVALPDIDEQKQIVKYLNDTVARIDEQLSRVNKQISLLQERKQIIINDVVTGKVKVA